MNDRRGMLIGAGVTLLACGAVAVGWWLFTAKPGEPGKPTPPPVPATVPTPFKEDQATAVTLTPQAEAALAIKVGVVEKKPMPRPRMYGGEVVVPPGKSVVVSAPLTGTLQAGKLGTPTPGLAVTKDVVLLQLVPLLDPVGKANLTASLADAEAQVQNTGEQLKAATNALDRAKARYKSESGTELMVKEAEDTLNIAKQAAAQATARRDLLKRVVGDLDTGMISPVPIAVPEGGVLRTVSALPGQTVPAGAPLFEVMNPEVVWVRVAVYVGDLAELDTGGTAAVGSLAGKPGDPTRPAVPVAAPPAANPAANTVDLFYSLDNRETRYRPGERVGAWLPLNEPAASPTVPWSAVVYDYHGGAWVYEATGNHTYTRRRVRVRYVANDTAVLEAGPPAGTRVVTAGAAELFGTEAGFSK
jgi:hypothetical protein